MKNVLIVEDHLEFGNQCVEFLLKNKFNVLYSDNAEKAKLQILKSKIDFAIIDLMLPPTFGIEGLNLYKYIKEKSKNIQVIFMTTKEFKTTEIVSEAMKLGAKDFLDKQNELFFDKLLVTINEMYLEEKTMKESRKSTYQPQQWEKIMVYLTGLFFVGVISFLIIRNEPFADPNFVVMIRTLLSLVTSAFGATVPGMLNVDFSKKGFLIRASGALALFVVTFFLTPKVL